MKFIDKDALVAEIERRIKSVNSCPFRTAELGSEKLNEGQLNAYNSILSYLNSFEVKDVDLEKEMDKYFDEHDEEFCRGEYLEYARHFFELGLKANNENKK